MFRQALSTSSRAISSTLRTTAQSPAIRSPAPFVLAQRSTQPRIARRWYSDEKKASEPPANEAKTETKEGEVEDPKIALQKEIEAKTKEIIDWKDKYLRSVADFRNLQDRTTREIKSAKDFAIQRFAKDLVDSIDNLDRALAMVPEDKLNAQEKNDHIHDLLNLYEGIRMTETVLMQTLKNHGLERYDPHGHPFNPNEHEATFMAPHTDKEHNTIFHTQQKGFKLHGRVLRPAKVGVVRNK